MRALRVCLLWTRKALVLFLFSRGRFRLRVRYLFKNERIIRIHVSKSSIYGTKTFVTSPFFKRKFSPTRSSILVAAWFFSGLVTRSREMDPVVLIDKRGRSSCWSCCLSLGFIRFDNSRVEIHSIGTASLTCTNNLRWKV
jgi:hypothetical protein